MKISVITAVYNAKDTVIDAIESVLNQTYRDIELIVIDGGSIDGTLELLERFEERLGVFVSEPDGGIYDALNKGIARASGEVIGFMHADDLFAAQDVLQKVADAFAEPEVDAVYGDLMYVAKSEPSRIIRYWKAGDYDYRKLKLGWMPPHPTFYVRRSVYERLGTFDTSLRIAADYDSMLRMLKEEGFNCHYIPEVLVKMRVGGESNRSLSNILRKSAEDLRVIRSNGIGGIGTLLRKNLSKLPQFVNRKTNE